MEDIRRIVYKDKITEFVKGAVGYVTVNNSVVEHIFDESYFDGIDYIEIKEPVR